MGMVDLTHKEQAENILDCVTETDVNENLLQIAQIEATLALTDAMEGVGNVLNEMLIRQQGN